LELLDSAVVVRYPDGSVTLNGESFVVPIHFGRHTIASFLAGLTAISHYRTGAMVPQLA
jgi:hypothetical protein